MASLRRFETSCICCQRIKKEKTELVKFLRLAGGSKICFDYFPNALSYPPPPAQQYPPPPGWENAERIEVHW
jgi:hypothetical protein